MRLIDSYSTLPPQSLSGMGVRPGSSSSNRHGWKAAAFCIFFGLDLATFVSLSYINIRTLSKKISNGLYLSDFESH
jgi:hypothetical protein